MQRISGYRIWNKSLKKAKRRMNGGMKPFNANRKILNGNMNALDDLVPSASANNDYTN